MSTELVQVTEKRWDMPRVPRGETPVVELHLGPNQRVIDCNLRPSHYDPPERKTVDWVCVFHLETRLGVPDA